MLQHNFYNSQLIKPDSYSKIHLGRYHVREGCDMFRTLQFFKKNGHSFEICCTNVSLNIKDFQSIKSTSASRKKSLFTEDQQRQFCSVMLLLQD